ncbi:MAG TPA: tetratricopeptide repeat protein, partial [Sphingobium sp.]
MLTLPVAAGASVDRTSALHAYARARLADSDGASGLAVQSYRRAMAGDPDSRDIARRSYSHALMSGDMALALQSAALLDGDGILSRDGTLLFLCDAFNRADWKAARHLTDRLTSEGNFGFLAPIILSWISLAEGNYVPQTIDATDRFASLARRYVDEHVALQALAKGNLEEAASAINRALALRTVDLATLRLSFAGQLARKGARKQALTLLPEGDADYARAREELQRGRRASGAGTPLTARQGYGRLLARLATDISSDDSTRVLAVRLARIAAFADPDSDDTHIILAKLLTEGGYADYGVAEAQKIAADGWFGTLGQPALVDALTASGDRDGAIVLARTLAAAPDADAERHVQLGRLLAQARQFSAAADAFRAAQARYAADAVPWALMLFEGSALEQAGRWDEARAVLERAVKIAPDEAVLLNHLGYAQIERRQNVEVALELLKKASALKPDEPSITDSLGWAQFVTGDVEAAVPVLERAA